MTVTYISMQKKNKKAKKSNFRLCIHLLMKLIKLSQKWRMDFTNMNYFLCTSNLYICQVKYLFCTQFRCILVYFLNLYYSNRLLEVAPEKFEKKQDAVIINSILILYRHVSYSKIIFIFID